MSRGSGAVSEGPVVPRPKNPDEGRVKSYRIGKSTQAQIDALRLEGETDSDVIRRVVREFAAAVLGGEGVAS
jgi:hypothetical protein